MNKLYPRLLSLVGIGSSMGVLWDGWWHVAVGRDQFWIPPHILVYLSLVTIFIASFIGYRKTKLKEFKILYTLSLFVPISSILDQIWHHFFGIENLLSPFVIWSPPHVLLFLLLFTIIIYIIKIATYEEDALLKWFSECGLFASLLGLILILVTPVYPLGSYHVLGFWGAGFVTLTWCTLVILAQNKINRPGTALLVTIIFCFLCLFGPPTLVKPAVGIIMNDFYNPPIWLFAFSFIIPAICLEILPVSKFVTKGFVSGLISGLIFYFSVQYLITVPSIQYGLQELLIAISASMLGGLVSGIIVKNDIIKI